MAEIASTTFSQTDASNTGPLPGLTGATNPNQIDNSIQAMMGAVKREHDWRNLFLTSGGSSNAYTLTYTVAPAAYYTGQVFSFTANFGCTGSATLNVNGLGAKTIKKDVAGTMTALSSGDIASGAKVIVSYDGTDFIWTNWQGAATSISAATDSAAGIVELATTTEILTGTDTSRAVTPDGLASLWEQGGDIASSGTITVGEGGYFNVTGTTTITDIDPGTDKAGRCFKLKFAGALTLTHNASTLILPTSANITTAAGDVAEFVSEGTDAVRCTNYHRADGTGLVAGGGFTLIATLTTTSGANQSVTGISNSYRYLYIELEGVSASVSDTLRIQVSNTNGSAYGASLDLQLTFGAAATLSGFIILRGIQLQTSTTIPCMMQFGIHDSGGGSTFSDVLVYPNSATPNEIDAINFFFKFAATFDAGTIRVYGVK